MHDDSLWSVITAVTPALAFSIAESVKNERKILDGLDMKGKDPIVGMVDEILSIE